jgi:hypothetical protein
MHRFACLSLVVCVLNLYNWNRHCAKRLSIVGLWIMSPCTTLQNTFLLDKLQHHPVGLKINNHQEGGTASLLLCTGLAISEPLVGSTHCFRVSLLPRMAMDTSSAYPTLPWVHSRSLWTSLAAWMPSAKFLLADLSRDCANACRACNSLILALSSPDLNMVSVFGLRAGHMSRTFELALLGYDLGALDPLFY